METPEFQKTSQIKKKKKAQKLRLFAPCCRSRDMISTADYSCLPLLVIVKTALVDFEQYT